MLMTSAGRCSELGSIILCLNIAESRYTSVEIYALEPKAFPDEQTLVYSSYLEWYRSFWCSNSPVRAIKCNYCYTSYRMVGGGELATIGPK